jgi:hypothetical protein
VQPRALLDPQIYRDSATFQGCPHSDSAKELFHTALALESVPGIVHVRQFLTEDEAVTVPLHGSPELRINEADLYTHDGDPVTICGSMRQREGDQNSPLATEDADHQVNSDGEPEGKQVSPPQTFRADE